MRYKILQDHVLEFDGHTLHRIRSIDGIPGYDDEWRVASGEIGGWIEEPANLATKSDSWITYDAKVYGGSRVAGGSWVGDNAIVCNGSVVSKGSYVSGDTIIDHTGVFNAYVGGQAVCKGCWIHADAVLVGSGDWIDEEITREILADFESIETVPCQWT